MLAHVAQPFLPAIPEIIEGQDVGESSVNARSATDHNDSGRNEDTIEPQHNRLRNEPSAQAAPSYGPKDTRRETDRFQRTKSAEGPASPSPSSPRMRARADWDSSSIDDSVALQERQFKALQQKILDLAGSIDMIANSYPNNPSRVKAQVDKIHARLHTSQSRDASVTDMRDLYRQHQRTFSPAPSDVPSRYSIVEEQGQPADDGEVEERDGSILMAIDDGDSRDPSYLGQYCRQTHKTCLDNFTSRQANNNNTVLSGSADGQNTQPDLYKNDLHVSEAHARARQQRQGAGQRGQQMGTQPPNMFSPESAYEDELLQERESVSIGDDLINRLRREYGGIVLGFEDKGVTVKYAALQQVILEHMQRNLLFAVLDFTYNKSENVHSSLTNVNEHLTSYGKWAAYTQVPHGIAVLAGRLTLPYSRGMEES